MTLFHSAGRIADGACSDGAAITVRRTAREWPMSRGSRVGHGREIGPRCIGPKLPANVELLQVIAGWLGGKKLGDRVKTNDAMR